MPKPKNIIETRYINLAIPLPEYTQVLLHLNSDLEGRVPHGAFSKFFTERIRQYFSEVTFDLAQVMEEGIPAGLYLIRGDRETVTILERKLA